MIDGERREFSEAIVALAAAFGREVDRATLLGYWVGMNDLPLVDVRRAVAMAIRTAKFFPRIVELRELSGVLSPEARALQAWDELCDAILIHGGYAAVQFADPAITSSVKSLGGWMKICSTPADQFDTWTRRDFLVIYPVHLASPPKSNPALMGMLNRDGLGAQTDSD